VINLNAARALGLTIPPGIMPAGTVKELVALIGAKPWQVTSLHILATLSAVGHTRQKA
jgi:hypothetical protein